jgi:Skp family chaperone for outer membrane proteins
MKKLATFIFMGIFIIIFVPINTASQANHIDRLQKEIADHQEKIKGYYQKIEEIRKHGQEEISNLEKKLGKTDDPGQKEYLRKRIEEIRKRLANDSYHWGHPAWTHITDYKKYIENSKNRIEEIKKKVKVLPEPVFYDEKEAKVSDVGRVLTPPPPSRKEKSVSITGSNSIKAGQTLQYKAWLHYTDGTKRDVTSTIKWMVYSLSGSGSSARVSKGRLRVLKVSPKGTLVQLSVKYSSSQHRISLDFTKDVRVIYWKKMLVKLSLGKPARQSSTGYGGTAQLAVDGNTDGNYFSGSTTHTNHEKNPWWEVDLGAVYKLENVLVYNRTDSCSERLDNFQVLVSVEPFPNSPVTANGYTIKGWIVQKAQNINRINLGKTQGRYVRIQLLGQNYLSLAEVIVNGVSTETDPTRTATTGEAKVSDVGRVTTTPSSDAGCRTLAQVYTDGSGDRRTKKLGGNYAAIRLDSLDDDQQYTRVPRRSFR